MPNRSDELLSFEVETIVPDLDVPWSMTFLPDNSMLITLKKGELIHFKEFWTLTAT